MRTILALSALALAAAAAPAQAQPYGGPPPGSYQRQCTDIYMEGQFLNARCRGVNGWAQSSINVLSCASDITVDAEGGLVCLGPGAVGRPGSPYAPLPAPYDPPGYGPGPGYGGYPGGYPGGAIGLFEGRGFRGQPAWIDGPVDNLDHTGLNDRVRSIRIERGSGPWIVCSDAGYRGRCVTVSRSVSDTRSLGLGDAISSVRPAW
ncbi:beta/gamma crystallin-related protein [Phenylobacterium terrae]|uniref:Beta/gamma crystallin-related protein n=1 Tax=Phenylobacterium terrae TaxID=2665495 RepID=A0ABW4N253_9CAUL